MKSGSTPDGWISFHLRSRFHRVLTARLPSQPRERHGYAHVWETGGERHQYRRCGMHSVRWIVRRGIADTGRRVDAGRRRFADPVPVGRAGDQFLCDDQVQQRHILTNSARRRGALRKEVRLSYIRLTASDIASQLYLGLAQVIFASRV